MRSRRELPGHGMARSRQTAPPQQLPRMLPLALFVGLLCGAFAPARAEAPAASRFPRRFRAAECSLFGRSASSACALDSTLGSDGNDRLLVSHGETNCTVVLRGCRKLCYAALDAATALAPAPDAGPAPAAGPGGRAPPLSFFSNIEVVRGGTLRAWTSQGFSVDADGGTDVVLRYSTITCGAFQNARGRIEAPQCSAPKGALTRLEHGLFPALGELCP